jgi:hypothetical protein
MAILTKNAAFYCKIIAMVSNFSAEKWSESPKIVAITLTPQFGPMTLPRRELSVETVLACPKEEPSKSVTLSYTNMLFIGQGAFGTVSQARLSHNGQVRFCDFCNFCDFYRF